MEYIDILRNDDDNIVDEELNLAGLNNREPAEEKEEDEEMLSDEES